MAGLLETQTQAEEASLDDPALEKAIEYIGQRLYSEDLSLSIGEQVDKSERSDPASLALIAYKLAEAADANADGDVKEENLSILGMLSLNEVMTIAEKTGMQVTPADASAAFKQMVVMFAEDQGVPPEQVQALSASMAQVNDQQLADEAQALPDNFDEMLPDEDVPVAEEEMS